MPLDKCEYVELKAKWVLMIRMDTRPIVFIHSKHSEWEPIIGNVLCQIFWGDAGMNASGRQLTLKAKQGQND